MRKSSLVVFLTVALLVAVLGSALAASIPERIDHQQRRINQGVVSGQLTRAETEILQGNLDMIKERYYKMSYDGTLTPPEREKLNRMLDRNSSMIYEKKHNPIQRLY